MNQLWNGDRHVVSRGRAVWLCVASSVITAAGVYFMDLEHGRRRRHMARDQFVARMRRIGRGMRGVWRGAAEQTYVASQRMQHLVSGTSDVANDETLRQRVESQLFRDPDIPKGALNISCEHGMVILRGEVGSDADIAEIEQRVRYTPGVRGVQNLLHTHGTPAPNKERSFNAMRPD